jgi:hypothetical protein
MMCIYTRGAEETCQEASLTLAHDSCQDPAPSNHVPTVVEIEVADGAMFVARSETTLTGGFATRLAKGRRAAGEPRCFDGPVV